MKNCRRENGLLPGGSPVSRTASPVNGKRRRTSAIYGLNVGECYANYDPKSHCLKTSQGFLFPIEDDSLMESCLTFTKAGLMRNGKLYRLRKSARPMLEKEYGLSVKNAKADFPTPTVNGNYNRKGASKTSGDGLATAIKHFPTPTAADATTGGIIGQFDEFFITSNGLPRRVNKNGKDGSLTLSRFVQFPGINEQLNISEQDLLLKQKKQYIPTPTASDYHTAVIGRINGTKKYKSNLKEFVKIYPTPRASMPGSRPNKKGGRILAEEVKKACNGQEGGLNPDWVEAMMGYPLYWTDTEKEIIEKNYPFVWLDGTWEKDIPRLSKNKKNRINRLKCLGNSVVPEIPALIWLMIKSYMKEC